MKHLPLKGPSVLSHSSGTSILGIPECTHICMHIHYEFRGHHNMPTLSVPTLSCCFDESAKRGLNLCEWVGGGSLIPKDIHLHSSLYLPKLQSRPQLCSHRRRSSVESYHLKHREQFKQPSLSKLTSIPFFLREIMNSFVALGLAWIPTNSLYAHCTHRNGARS